MSGSNAIRRVAIYSHLDESIVSEHDFGMDERVVIGSSHASNIRLDGWRTDLILIEGNAVQLTPGMRVNMCGDLGADPVVGTFEELARGNSVLWIAIRDRRINVRLSPAYSAFIKQVLQERE